MIHAYKIEKQDYTYIGEYPDELHLNIDIAMEFMDKFTKDNLAFTDSDFIDWKEKNCIILKDDKLATGTLLQYNNGSIHCIKASKLKTLLIINRDNKLSMVVYNRNAESVIRKLTGG